jgi:hypothetical protein
LICHIKVFAVVHDTIGTRTWLYLIAHHLIVDAVSWQILTSDIGTSYRALRAGRDLPNGAAPGMPTRPATKTGRDAHWEALATARCPRQAAPTPGGDGVERWRLRRNTDGRASGEPDPRSVRVDRFRENVAARGRRYRTWQRAARGAWRAATGVCPVGAVVAAVRGQGR